MVSLGNFLPSFSVSGVLGILMWALIGISVMAILAGITIFIFNEKKYIYKLVIFKRVGNNIEPYLKTKAKPVRLRKSGDYIWYVRKAKKWIQPQTIQTRRNEYWIYVRDDGEWQNFRLTDIDNKLSEANVFFVNEDVRLSNVMINRKLEERFSDKSFLNKYGYVIGYAIFVVIVLIGFMVIANQLIKGAETMAQANAKAIEAYNVCSADTNEVITPDREQSSSNSGLIPADTGG